MRVKSHPVSDVGSMEMGSKLFQFCSRIKTNIYFIDFCRVEVVFHSVSGFYSKFLTLAA